MIFFFCSIELDASLLHIVFQFRANQPNMSGQDECLQYKAMKIITGSELSSILFSFQYTQAPSSAHWSESNIRISITQLASDHHLYYLVYLKSLLYSILIQIKPLHECRLGLSKQTIPDFSFCWHRMMIGSLSLVTLFISIYVVVCSNVTIILLSLLNDK